MHAATLLIGAAQMALLGVVCYLLFLLHRDSRRASLVALITVLNDLREKNAHALTAVLTLMASDSFRLSDEAVRAGLLDSAKRLRAIQDAITEALLQTLRQCDADWKLSGRLHAALRSQLDPGTDRQWEQLAGHQHVALSSSSSPS